MALNLLLLRSPPNTNMILSNDPAYLREVDGSSTTRLGLILYLDASDPNSWKGGSTGTWYDISGGGNHISVSPTAYHNTGSIGYMDFSGPYGCAKYQVSDFVPGVNTITAVVWTQILNNTSTWRTLFRSLSTGANHQVIVQTGAYLIGMYDNDNSSAFNSSGYSQQSLPGYSTWRWNMMVWRWQGSNPYYQLSINDAPQTILGSIASSNAGWGADSWYLFNRSLQQRGPVGGNKCSPILGICIFSENVQQGFIQWGTSYHLECNQR